MPTLEHVLTFLLRVCVMGIARLPGPSCSCPVAPPVMAFMIIMMANLKCMAGGRCLQIDCNIIIRSCFNLPALSRHTSHVHFHLNLEVRMRAVAAPAVCSILMNKRNLKRRSHFNTRGPLRALAYLPQ